MIHKLFSPIVFAVFFCLNFVYGQNISVNTTGTAAAAANLFEVLQPSTTNNTVGIFASHSGVAANAYAVWAEATGGTNRYAVVVPAGGGSVGIGTTTPATLLHLSLNDAITAAASNLLTIDHTSTGVAAVGFGAGQLFNLENDVGSLITSGQISSRWLTATAGSEQGAIYLSPGGIGGAVVDRVRVSTAGVIVGLTGIATPAVFTINQLSSPSGNNAFRITGGAHTGQPAGTESNDVYWNLARNVQFNAGAITTQRTVLIEAPTYAFTGASIITNAATVAITGAPMAGANATITNPSAFWVMGGNSWFGGNVGIGSANPTASLHINNGHIRSQQSVAPTIVVTTANGITAAAITAGSTDTKGNITTTGTNSAPVTTLTVTFDAAYTVAPTVIINSANPAARLCNDFVTSTTTTFVLNFAAGGANPSFNYLVIE